MEQFMINCIEILPEADGLADHSLYKNLKAGKYLLNDYYELEGNDDNNLTRNNKFLSSSFFYGKGINIQAIVGKNGCGKSTLMDLLFAAANNYGYIIDRNEYGEGESHALYIADLYLRLYYTQGTNDYVLTFKDQEIFKSDITRELVIDESVVIQKRLANESFCYNPKDSKVLSGSYKGKGLNYEEERLALEKFFYTIVSNYSIHSFIDQNYNAAYYTPYKQGGTIAKRTRGEAAAENKSWIRAIFHKNDGYFRPVVLNPFRDNGIIDVNNEIELSKERLASLLIFYSKNEENPCSPYDLKKIQLFFQEFETDFILSEFVDKYFGKEIDRNFKEEASIRDFVELSGKLILPEERKKIFIEEYLANENNCFLKEMLQFFELSFVKDNVIAKTAYFYLQMKIFKIINQYASFKRYSQTIRYDYAENGFVVNNSELNELLKKIVDDNSHITRKIRRTINFLALENGNFREIYEWNKRSFFDRFSFANNSIFLRGKTEEDLNIDDMNDCLPPPFFEYDLIMDKKGENGSVVEENVNYRGLSSGETQMLQTLSIHAYHISNLLSVPHDRINYDNINLIFDEVELCFHPEFQRQFINRLVIMLRMFRDNYEKKGESQSETWKCFFNVLILTHSPFVLSDIQLGRTLFLEENGMPDYKLSKKSTFAGNIGEMFYESMFMKNTIGEFAAKQLNDLINTFPSLRKNSTDYLLAKKKIGLVSDSILRNLLLEKLEREVQ